MKKLLSLAVAAMLGLHANAQSDAEMKAWQEYMTPGDVHKMVASWDGIWKTETKMWMAPGAEPTTAAGTCTYQMVLGGRYQQTSFNSDFMGMPFEGLGTLAYDNAKQVFVSTWIDNMSTGTMILQGKWNDKTRSMTLTGTTTDFTTKKDSKVREVYTVKSDNEHVMETWMVDTKTGKEWKGMEIAFRR